MPDPDLLVTLLLAAFIHGMLGFGFPLIATPVLALFMDLVPDAHRERVKNDLISRLNKDKTHLRTGFVGTPYLCRVLSKRPMTSWAVLSQVPVTVARGITRQLLPIAISPWMPIKSQV